MKLLFVFILSFFCALSFAQHKAALLVGISDYPQFSVEPDMSWRAIHGVNDIKMIESTLKKQGFSVCMLEDERASAVGIRKALVSVLSNVTEGDIVYLHFSMHGQPVKDDSGDEFDGWDESIVPYDAMKRYKLGVYEGDNHILDDELHAYIQNIREKTGKDGIVYVVIDACHSGNMARDEETDDMACPRGTSDGFSKDNSFYAPKIDLRGNFTIDSDEGMSDVCIVEACRSYQSNYEIKENGDYYGPLSFYINKVLEDHIVNSDISWISLVKDLMKRDIRLKRQNIVIESNRYGI